MILELKGVHKAFGTSGEPGYQEVLRGIDLKVGEGDSLAVLGPSGSGKSTLLNIIGTLERADRGSVVFRNRDISGFSEKESDLFRNREIGFVFQFHHLLPQCNLFENVLVPTLADRSIRDKGQKYAEELLNRVGLWEHRHKVPGQLSGGECQRAALVRALVNKPSVLLADEPTGALDEKNVSVIAELLKELNKELSVTLILVTHSGELAAGMDRMLKLENGKLKDV